MGLVRFVVFHLPGVIVSSAPGTLVMVAGSSFAEAYIPPNVFEYSGYSSAPLLITRLLGK